MFLILRHVHEHDPRVDARPAVERVAGEAVVPGDAGLLVLGGHGRQLGGVEARQERPQSVHGLQEEDVRVHVYDRVDVPEDQLHKWRVTQTLVTQNMECGGSAVLWLVHKIGTCCSGEFYVFKY